ncbi:MAG: acetyl-CoA carboxylase biotin carboxyl carrier protein subunit, partial [Desulforhopalus sp.]
GHRLQAQVDDRNNMYRIFTQEGVLECALQQADFTEDEGGEGSGGLTAPMTGTVVALAADAGSRVNKGDTLLIMEAMKMEHVIRAPEDGQIVEFYCGPGDLVDGGAALLDFKGGD